MSTAAIVLAAGFSTRMGTPNKLLMPVGGQPVIVGVIRGVMDATDTVPVVVLGHEADVVSAALRGFPVHLVTNPDPARGQSSSVRLGLEAAPEADETLVVLGDQPLLTGDALIRLLRAHRQNGGDRITVPRRGEDRGNPIVIPWHLRRSILETGTNVGCGSFTRKNPELTRAFETNDPAYFFDVDTPDDLIRARTLLEGHLAS